MTTGTLGMAPAQALAFASRMSADANNMRDLMATVGRLVADVAWFGNNADLFRRDWEGRLRRQLLDVTAELDRTAHALQRHAVAQQQVSDYGS